MNFFRLSADLLHLASILLLLLKIYATKNTKGISLKTQVLFLIVFCTRYLDVLTNWRNPYNVVMKGAFSFSFRVDVAVCAWLMWWRLMSTVVHTVDQLLSDDELRRPKESVVDVLSEYPPFDALVLFLGFSALTVYWIGWRYNKGYDKEHDTFRLVFVLAPAAVLAVVTPKPDPYSVVDTLWTASIYLEAVAILPQLFLVRRTGEVENLTSNYIAAMGAYRFFYILNWIFRYYTEPEYYGIPGNFVVWIGGLVQTALYADFFYYFFRSKWHGQKFTLPGATDV